MPRRLEALAAAAMALGWDCVQAANDFGVQPVLSEVDPETLTAALGPQSARPGAEADWRRFDAAWRRVRREFEVDDLAAVGLALIDFAQACRVTAARLDDPASERAS